MKRIYGAITNCELIRDFLSCMGDMRRAENNGDIDERFIKRIMLAIDIFAVPFMLIWAVFASFARHFIPVAE